MKFMVPFVAAAAIAATASAGFEGFSTENIDIGGGKTVSKVYACFNGASDTLLNVFDISYAGGVDTSGFGSGNFYHSDFSNFSPYSSTTGTWNPGFTPAVPFPPLSAYDSFLTIGGGGGPSNTWTTADPDFGDAGLGQAGLVEGAGWYNGNPSNLKGLNDGGKVFIGQFVIDTGKGWFVNAQVGFNQGLGTSTVFGAGMFTIGVPAPGAVALLGLAGLAGRRRRA
ncbi:MAG: hypothetical protein JNL80_14225 [Phycisphaerae bacterium]|nr:hypothetical protein [Phycisphaerae bacterium]